MIGTLLCARSRWHTTRPSRSGRPRSSNTMSAGSAASASAPVDAISTSKPSRASPSMSGARDGRVVFDHQDPHGLSMFAAERRGGTGRESPLPNACLGLADRWSVSPYVQGMNTPQRQKPAGWFSSRTRSHHHRVHRRRRSRRCDGRQRQHRDPRHASDSDVGTVSAAGDLTPPGPR